MTGGWSDAYPADPQRRLDGPPFTLRTPEPPQPPCKCTHQRRAHGADRKQRPMCHGSVVCGCTEYRPQETK